MSQSKRTRRLLLCGVCFKESCQYSRWIEEDEPDGELLGILDEIQQMWLQSQHEQIELFEASRSQIETVIDNDAQTIANESGEVIEVQAVIDGEYRVKEYSPVQTEKGSFIEDILARNAEHPTVKPIDQQKEH